MHETGNCCKKGSQPRHNIEFQPFNKYCKWEVHHTSCPFEIVSNIPKKCYKTALNAYNRYHQVPLHKNSTKLNIFISSFGKYLYLYQVVLIVDAMMTYQQGFSQTFLLTSIFYKRLSLTAIDWGLGAAVGHSSPLVFKKPFHTSLDDLIFSFFRSLFSFCTDPLYHWWLLKVKKE